MSRLRTIFISVVLAIALIGCGKESKEESVENEVVYTGELISVSDGAKQEIVNKEIVETPYVSVQILDDIGAMHEVHYYDNLMDSTELIIGSTLTLNANEITTISGETINTEYVGTFYSVDHIPLELVIGKTSYELMSQTSQWYYKEIHSEITMTGTMVADGRTVPYEFNDMVTKETDGQVFHSVQTMSETVDTTQQNESIVVYSDLDSGQSFININYAQWDELSRDTQIDTLMDITQSEVGYEETAYYEESGRYIVEGTSKSLEDGYISGLIKYALSDYDYDNSLLSYTFRAIFDKTNEELIFADYDLTYDGILTSDNDTLELDTFNILISNIAYNNVDTVIMPGYIGDSISERLRPKFLCEAYFDVSPEQITEDWVRSEFNITVEQDEDSESEDIQEEEAFDEEEDREGEDSDGDEDTEEEQPERKLDNDLIVRIYIDVLTNVTVDDVSDWIDSNSDVLWEDKVVYDIIKSFAILNGDYQDSNVTVNVN